MNEAPRQVYARRDWLAFGIVTLVALAGYWFTLAPGVTLEDSGEFITAAYTLGVPHPPGYPTWTMLGWVWCHLLPVGNIAWRLNLMSAIFSALAAGLAALLISRSGREMAGTVKFMQPGLSRPAERVIVLAGAVAAGLILAFCPVMWSQAVVTEVYGPNACLLMATLAVLYRWSFQPERLRWLYLAALLWGVGLTMHQTVVLLAVAFPTFIWLTDRQLGRDVLVPILLVVLAWMGKLLLGEPGTFSAVVYLALGVGSVVWLYFLWKEGPGLLRQWRPVGLLCLAVLAGLALYVYLPAVSATNPPMNWGNTRTLEGFVRHFTRGQYNQVTTDRPLWMLWGQLNLFFVDVQDQFTIGFALVALVTVFFYRELSPQKRNWLKFLLVAFLFLAGGFLFLSNPSFEKLKQFNERIFFLPGYCVYALWIGYGLILGLGFVVSRKNSAPVLFVPLAAMVAALPVWSVKRNWANSELRGHDFGYRFGYRMFQPGGGYPEMARDAVLFSGTDAGRFVGAYMIFVESQVPAGTKTQAAGCPASASFDRRDVTIITQNALADAAYIQTLREQYGLKRPANDAAVPRWLGRDRAYPAEPIWIPAQADVSLAFRQLAEELRTRRPQPGEVVTVKDGRINVSGPLAILAINATLSRMIFDRNKDRHTFYLEESYAVPWMYPFLEPYGVIFRLTTEPQAQLRAQSLAHDRAYWDALTRELLADPRFRRDDEAQRHFAKLRTAIGGLYAYRKLPQEAEYAYRQALALCPDSYEAHVRLAQLYGEQNRCAEGRQLLENYLKYDQYNIAIREMIVAFGNLQRQLAEIAQLEQLLAAEPDNLSVALQLVKAYSQRRRLDDLDSLANRLLNRLDLTPNDFLQLAQAYADVNRYDRMEQVLTLLTRRHPQSGLGWYLLAVVESLRNKCPDCVAALQRAFALDRDNQLHLSAQQDPRLNNCRTNPAFQELLPPVGAPFRLSP